jgi:glycosyltransferase involved in cell wall biosynthesis
VARTRVRGVSWLRDRAALARRLRALARGGGLDVVESPDYDGPLATGFDEAPVVLRLHGAATWCAGFGARRPPAPVRWCERRAAARHAAWIHPSLHVLEGTKRALAAAPRRAALVPHPVPSAPVEAVGPPAGLPRGPVVLFVGSLWEFRGVLAAARAARRFLRRVGDASMVFVGPECTIGGRASSEAIREAAGPEVADRVRFTGRVAPAEVARWMRAARVFLYPSPHEAFGLVYLEAMREGLPVVGPSRGTGPEIVEDGMTGLLADPGDDEALAAHVERLLLDEGLARRLAEAARRRLDERFSLDRCVAESLAFYAAAARDAAGTSR